MPEPSAETVRSPMSAAHAKTHMVSRIGLALAICATVPVLLFAIVAAHLVATTA